MGRPTTDEQYAKELEHIKKTDPYVYGLLTGPIGKHYEVEPTGVRPIDIEIEYPIVRTPEINDLLEFEDVIGNEFWDRYNEIDWSFDNPRISEWLFDRNKRKEK